MDDKKKPISQRVHTQSSDTDTSTQNSEANTSSSTKVRDEACPECDGVVITESQGEVVCSDCGLIIEEENIDHGPEWRAFDSQERSQKSRVGSPKTELRHDKGLSTNIGWQNKDAYGNTLSSKKQSQISRLRKWDNRIKSSTDSQSEIYANSEIKRMGGALGIPRGIQETAGKVYSEAQHKDLISGRSIESVASATLYISLRIHNNPRPLSEVADVSRIEKKPIQSAYRYLCKELDIALKPIDPEQYVSKIAKNINLNITNEQETPNGEVSTGDINIKKDLEKIIKQTDGIDSRVTKDITAKSYEQEEIVREYLVTEAKEILGEVARTKHTSGHDPTVLAATAIYTASIVNGTILTQKSVKEASDVTEVSIRKNYVMMLTKSPHIDITEDDILDDDSPKDISEKLNENVIYINSEL